MAETFQVWCIGPDGTEYYAARSEEEMKAYYVGLVGEEQAKEDFDDYFELVPESKMDVEFDFSDDGNLIQTTWRKLLEGVTEPTQISSSYC